MAKFVRFYLILTVGRFVEMGGFEESWVSLKKDKSDYSPQFKFLNGR